MRPTWAAVATLVAGSLLVAACTSDEQDDGSAPNSTTSATDPSPSDTSTTTEPEPETEPEQRAIVVNVHRPALDLTRRQASRLLAGRATTWHDLGQRGGTVTAASGPGAVRDVERDLDAIGLVPIEQVGPTVQLVTVDGTDPIRTPHRYPFGRPSDAPPAVTTMTIVGDIMLDRRIGATAGGPAAALRPMSRSLAAADLTVGNLESALSMDGAPTQDDAFAADPSVLRPLDRAGFDLLSLANNHTGDYGQRALLKTMAHLDASPIDRVGAGRSATEAWQPTVLQHDGVTFGFLAFNAIGETPRATRTTPGAAEIRMQPRTGPLNQRDLAAAERRIGRLARTVDVVIVLPHWGDQYTHQPVPDQRRVGRALVDAGASLVVGGHPHWVQGIQTRGDTLIVQSLGNFVFDMDINLPGTVEGVTAELTFADDRLVQARLRPYVIGADFAPRPVEGVRAEAILTDVWTSSDPPFAPVG